MEATYQPFEEDSEETPQDSGVMIHIVPEGGKAARWNHIEDLDSFFTQIYTYHQGHGFFCMMLEKVLRLLQYIFMVIFCLFLFNCVDYPVLFRDKSVSNKTVNDKVTIRDAVYPYEQCVANVGFWSWLTVMIAVVVWIYHAVKFISQAFQYWDVKAFFNTALKISDSELDNVTWHEVQTKLREVQREQQMCIHKKELSQLDIYHRILRFKNYLVAMVNKSLLPVRLCLPFVGEQCYMSRGLKFNYELLFFRGPWSPFKDSWHLKEEFKKVNRRHELAQHLQTVIFCVGIANLALCPLIFFWQIAFAFFNHAELLKREPGALSIRCWSVYADLYLRHFNELDHELRARLNRAYEPASKYVSGFTAPVLSIISKYITFIAGAISGALVGLSIYDEDVLLVEHVLTIITCAGAVFAGFRAFIPNENMVWRPESLMTQILAQVHYLPYNWRGLAHTTKVHKEFSQLFQYKAVYLLQELISPLVTPLILLFYLRPRALEIVDFFRNFTVEVVGVGDVCSFAQMDVRRHGNPSWQSPSPSEPQANQYTQAEDGKTELSLIHFTHTNPDWQLPDDAQNFVSAVRTQARQDHSNYFQINGDGVPENCLASVGVGLSSMFPRLAVPGPSNIENPSIIVPPSLNMPNPVVGRAYRAEGPLTIDRWNRYMSPHQALLNPSLGASVFGPGVDTDRFENAASDMSNSALYIHELHRRRIKRRGYHESCEPVPIWQRTGIVSGGGERTPLLHMPSHPS